MKPFKIAARVKEVKTFSDIDRETMPSVLPCAFTASLQQARAAQQLDRARQHMRSLLRTRLTRHARGVALSPEEAEALIELLATPGGVER